jgi:hypothetical protein
MANDLISPGVLKVTSSGLADNSHQFESSVVQLDSHAGSSFMEGPRATDLVIGNRELLACLEEIRQLRRRCGQEDDLTTDPEYFIAANTVPNRRCAAVLIRQNRELEACVLFYEHTSCGVGLGLFRGGDYIGESLIAGPQALHVQYVHLAIQALLKKWRIHGVSITMKACATTCIQLMGPASNFRRFRGCEIQHKLYLESTYEGMLASMGPRTRRSLAGKRQQLEKTTDLKFIAALAPEQSLEVMLGLEDKSMPHRPTEFIQARYRLQRANPDFFSMGLRLPDGPWLSIVTGWRRNGVTYVDLQMNDMHYKKESISAVMRAFLLEHEIACKQEVINFVGGSSLLLRRYCEPIEPNTDIFIYKPGVLSMFFEWLGRRSRSGSVYERLKPGATSAGESQLPAETEN